MLKTIAALAIGGFVLKRTSPKTYAQVVTALDDTVTIMSDVTTAARGQIAAYTAEAAADATQRLRQVNPDAVAELRAMLDAQQPAQPQKP